ncbi:MAG: hypothetical protein A2015_14025 [Spirochaetes bacterium GWF1_31_7]|nr:MAG: hypothetical protein A2Y30_03725 [Spirochaetes bacterium GWE1_32_154]OHD48125.1 MAG: hypothetical protein A2Y29_10830 [Spirochaetes bacterium GWE2_31_10]OHD50520.1 MAG: hypothetical protein A2015_14025 [Spirochaetes bacterium GWF1_31_7]OHD81335.1 MAG: hypothetical protein A2355_10925 [Spirochaetes bacterium RIFOXYB1_FULL_32_8]HBD94169.1 hypothetical protein [Spirochaetia bacterium]
MSIFKRFFVLSALLISLFFIISCDVATVDTVPETKPTDTVLTGYWKSSFGDGFEITGSTFISYADSEKTITYKGDIIKVLKESATAGAYVMKIFESTEIYAPKNGTYYVVRWKDYALKTVNEAAPYKEGAEYNGLSTQSQAESEYTIANGYYGFFGAYEKQ